ncbi:MAG: cytochrome c biogenesis CcdA family protein [Candidatus Limnocylindrales bacterium]
MELTLAAAFVAGLISFLSPCVLPVVPAYLGQLGAAAVVRPGPQASLAAATATTGLAAGLAGGATVPGNAALALPSPAQRRWQLLPYALAFVLGFGTVFTCLGLTVYVGGTLLGLTIPGAVLTVLRQLGGILLIILGLNLAGILRLDRLQRSWRPLDTYAMRRGMGGQALGGTPLGSFGLGAIFALGWTPCVGPTLGAILGLAALGASAQVVLLFVAYSLGLAVPFLVAAMALDRSTALLRPLRRHAQLVELVGGLLVAGIGVAILFDWLGVLASTFSFLNPSI